MLSNVDMREVSPDAPRYTAESDRCPTRSYMRPECQCVLQVGHANQGFIYCQFDLAYRTGIEAKSER